MADARSVRYKLFDFCYVLYVHIYIYTCVRARARVCIRIHSKVKKEHPIEGRIVKENILRVAYFE